MAQKKPLLILVDGYGLIFRAFYTVREMSFHGQPTNALFGFVAMILKIMEREPDALLVALDWHGETQRKKKYSEYKANRDEAPEDLKSQIARLRNLIESMGISWMEVAEQEADDVIGTLANSAVNDGYEVAIVTGDHDLCQLVSDDIKVLYTLRGTSEFKEYNHEAVFERFGVSPEHLIDYKALVGDSSDNIPGVKGVGDKTAKKLLAEYKDIDEIYSHIDDIKQETLKKKLGHSKENAFLSRKLATIRTELDIKLPGESRNYFNPETAFNIFNELGFSSFIKRLGLEDKEKAPVLKPDTKVDFTIIQSIDELENVIIQIENKGEVAFDVETSSLDARKTKLVGIALAIGSNSGWYIPLGHADPGDLLSMLESKHFNLTLKDVISRIKPVLESDKIGKIAQNAKFEYLVMSGHGIELRNLSFDTMIASYIINPDDRHNLKELGLQWLNRKMVPIIDLIGSGKNQASMSDVAIETVASYAVDDASVTWGLYEKFKNELEKSKMDKLYYEIELPLVTVLAEMEREGIRLNAGVLREISTTLQKDINELAADSIKILGKDINLNSPKQLSDVLFNELNLPNPKKGSTNIDVLLEIKDTHPIVPLVIEYRSISKIRSTYAEGLLHEVDPEDGRIHTSFNQALTSTGRLSSSKPNLQNIPIRTEKGRLIRKAFMPNSDNHVLLSADYSQIELRLLAHYSKDAALIKAFKEGEDIHARTAREILPLENGVVTPDDRRMAKVVNFGIIYGMSAFSLSKELGISRSIAKSFIDGYFARYPQVRVFYDELLENARKNGYVETFMGRRRYIQDLNSKNGLRRSNAERAAINMPLQGGAADIMKKAMVELRNALLEKNLKSRILLQVHDEVLLSVPKNEFDIVKNLTEDILSNTCKLEVPLIVNLKSGENWYELEDL